MPSPEFEHGTPHGPYKRYRESGEVSRHGWFVRGKLQGTDVFIRSDKKTSENFPAGLGSQVWRAEMEMAEGRIVSGRLFDKNGQQVGEDGAPCPERPPGVPETAVFSCTGGLWLVGKSNEECLRDGLWQFYAQDGTLEREIEYRSGEVARETVHSDPSEDE